MEIIKGDRCSGKTMELIRISHYTKKVIVCHTRMTRNLIKENAIAFGFDIPEPVAIIDLEIEKSKHINRFKQGVLIDEVDDVLEYILDLPVSHVTTGAKVINIPLSRRFEY